MINLKELKEANIERIGATIDGKIPIRLYSYEGQLGCSVSTACDLIVPLGLQNYYKKGEYKKLEERKESTANIGSNGHALIEKQSEGKEVVPPEELKEWFGEWEKTQVQYSVGESELHEVKVFSKLFAYGGQLDDLRIFNGKRCLIDYKTGRYSHINLWKLEAYRQAYIEMTGDREVGAVVLHLPRPDLMARGQKVAHYTIERHETCFLSFLCAYQNFCLYYYKDLLKAGMTEKDVFSLKPFWLYEREYGSGVNK